MIVDRHQIGASFSRWPKEMSFITPSFPSHGFGLLDLNAVTLKTSPAIAFRSSTSVANSTPFTCKRLPTTLSYRFKLRWMCSALHICPV
ncbi:NAD(P)-binding domain-containing protein [Leptolyngbya ectocarpi]|uniref:NAD(P)-binding domain-containing protein n=1 Tax=Leptolyngbya ectocarpi TaxID=1202 RepID=UPI001D146DD0|nr:NAD(P)-binding domain-containing protein [Leptolyngbya ectocarpi]